MIQIFDRKGFDVLVTIETPTLQQADLSGLDLNLANMVQYDLRQANLNSAKLCGADLRLARLDHADLRNADLSQADLSGADLSHAELQGAILNETVFTDACRPSDFSLQQPGQRKLASIRVSTTSREHK